MAFQDDQSKVLDLLSLKLAFLWLEEQPLLLEGSKDLADNPLVFGEGMGVNKDIIHIAYHLTIVDELTEDIIHHCLECCGGVTQSEKHDGVGRITVCYGAHLWSIVYCLTIEDQHSVNFIFHCYEQCGQS